MTALARQPYKGTNLGSFNLLFPVPAVRDVLALVARVGGFAALAPTLTGRDVSPRHRIALAAVLAVMLIPMLPAASPTITTAGHDAFGKIVTELMVGLAFGFAFRAVQTAMLLASQLMEQQLGMPFLSEVADDEAGSPLGRLYQLIAGAIFFTLGGHRLVIGSLVDLSADVVASGWDRWAVLDGLVTILGQACWMGVRTAAPIALVLMTTSLAVGMLSRVLPQFAGPAVIISFIIAAIVAGLAAFSYAEMASMVHTSGSAYSYTYASMYLCLDSLRT